MPDLSKLFSKRLGEENYKNLLSFFSGKTTYKNLPKPSQRVLDGLETQEQDRTFTQQELLYELKQKLVTNKFIAPDSDAWDMFETTYRMYIVGHEARSRFFKEGKPSSFVKEGETYQNYAKTKKENYQAYEESGKKKWAAKAERDFQKDLELGNIPLEDVPLSVQKRNYIARYNEWLDNPQNTGPLALEYRRDLGKKYSSDVGKSGIEMTEYKPFLEAPQVLDRPFSVSEAARVPKDFNDILNKFIEEKPMSFSFGVGGLQIESSQFSAWVKKQASEFSVEGIGINIATGFALTGLLDFIAKHSHMTAQQKHVMNFSVTESLGALQLGLAESELGVVVGIGALLASPLVSLIGWLRSPGSRRVDNDDPEKIYGRQFARVRSMDEQGRTVWYPAILASKDEWTGLGSTEQNIRLNYGKLEDLHWRYNKDGTFSPFFTNPRYKLINATNKDLSENGSEELRLKYDPLRDYSLLTNDETGKLFDKLLKGGDLSEFKERVDDRSKQPKYIQELTSYRDDMEYVRTFNLGGEKIGRGLNPADRAIRREFEHSVLVDPKYMESSGIYFDMMNDNKYKQGFTKYKHKLKENKALLLFFKARVQDLLRSQQTAAEESGFLDVLKKGKFNYHDDHFNSLLYALDTGYPPAKSLDELKKQNSKTQDRLDLKWFEKNYLQQKNMVRYFGQKLSGRALGGDIAHKAMYPHQRTYRLDKPPYTETGLNYDGILSANGTLRLQQVGHKSVFGNPPGPWSNSDEQTIPSWLFEGKFRGIIFGPGHVDYKEESEKLKKSFEREYLQPLLARAKYNPSKLMVSSNPGLFPKIKLTERVDTETAEEKRARLKALKTAPLVALHHIKPLTTTLTSGDIYNKQDKFYKRNKNFGWDLLAKKYVPNKHKQKLGEPKNVTWEQRFGKKLEGAQKKLFGHGTVGLDPKKTKLEKLGSDKGRDSRKKELEKQRAFDRLRASSEQARITSDEFSKKRKHHGMNYYEYHEFIKDHSGKTPDEVFKQGAWKVAKNGGSDPVTVVPKPKKKTVIPKVVVKPVIPKVVVKPVTQDPYKAFREYLKEQHNVIVPKDKPLNVQTYPWLAVTEQGKPALFGDHVLHDKLKLGDAFRVVTTKTGFFHRAYDPSKVQPKFFQTHETSVVSTY